MDRMKLIGKFCIVLLTLTFCLRADAQSRESDVFIPIGKYIMQGNADALSAWFDDNLEIKLLSQGGDVSKSQARQIVKSFFEAYAPRSFEVTSTASRGNTRHAIGTLRAGGEVFGVTILVSCKEKSYHIRQLKFEKAD
jgi:hypothetical protein